MKDFDFEELKKDLAVLAEKHKLRNIVFGGEYEDRFVGQLGLNSGDLQEYFASSLNAARAYQSSREKLFHLFDEIAKKR